MIIHLVGPGGAGKSRVGAALASRLGVPFLDLDSEFKRNVGDISRTIDRGGYEAYARKNVETYLAVARANPVGVVALSSGFMVYPESIHPLYRGIRSVVARSRSTFVLLPSIDLERCVRETVRRQLSRPFARSESREELVIRERYGLHMALPAAKVETMRPVAEVVERITTLLQPCGRVRLTWEPVSDVPSWRQGPRLNAGS